MDQSLLFSRWMFALFELCHIEHDRYILRGMQEKDVEGVHPHVFCKLI